MNNLFHNIEPESPKIVENNTLSNTMPDGRTIATLATIVVFVFLAHANSIKAQGLITKDYSDPVVTDVFELDNEIPLVTSSENDRGGLEVGPTPEEINQFLSNLGADERALPVLALDFEGEFHQATRYHLAACLDIIRKNASTLIQDGAIAYFDPVEYVHAIQEMGGEENLASIVTIFEPNGINDFLVMENLGPKTGMVFRQGNKIYLDLNHIGYRDVNEDGNITVEDIDQLNTPSLFVGTDIELEIAQENSIAISGYSAEGLIIEDNNPNQVIVADAHAVPNGVPLRRSTILSRQDILPSLASGVTPKQYIANTLANNSSIMQHNNGVETIPLLNSGIQYRYSVQAAEV